MRLKVVTSPRRAILTEKGRTHGRNEVRFGSIAGLTRTDHSENSGRTPPVEGGLDDRRPKQAELNAGVEETAYRRKCLIARSASHLLRYHYGCQNDGCMTAGTQMKGAGAAVLIGRICLTMASSAIVCCVAVEHNVDSTLGQLSQAWRHGIGE